MFSRTWRTLAIYFKLPRRLGVSHACEVGMRSLQLFSESGMSKALATVATLACTRVSLRDPRHCDLPWGDRELIIITIVVIILHGFYNVPCAVLGTV